MSLLSSDDAETTSAALPHPHDTHGLAIVHDDLPDRWVDGDESYLLHRIDATTWKVAFEGIVLGVLTFVPPISIGDPSTWKIGDPAHETLGAGVSWTAWEDAVANLVDYRRSR